MVVFGDEVTKVLRNSLFTFFIIFHFRLAHFGFANGKHRTENHATKVTKTRKKQSYQNEMKTTFDVVYGKVISSKSFHLNLLKV